jgi:sugar phosphate isomerase/epimerase
MDRLSLSETTTYRWTFEQDVQKYAAAGLKRIGVWRQKLSDFGEEKGCQLLRQHRLRASSLLWAGGFTGSDGRTYRDSLDDAREAIRVAQALAADCLVVYTGGRAGHTHNHARRLIRNALTALLPHADAAGVTLALEPMHPGCAADWTFLTDVNEAVALVETLNSPRLKLVFDAYHFGHSRNAIETIRDLAPHVKLVQLGDARRPPDGEQNRCRIGEGAIPLREIIAAFEQAGYDGSYEIELLGEEIETADYDELLKQSLQVFGDMMGAASARE